ncbi:MAG: hypothetical protein HRU19_11400 [Pseudobacteriovorax sp.]|nr:hypothetical protein [Pseudobacteriovorax sp.]
MFKFGILLLSMLATPILFGQSHAGVDQNRTAFGKDVFVDQSVKAIDGTVVTSSDATTTSSTWRGFGLKNGVGIELLRFMQLSLNHTYVGMRAKHSSLEHFSGSELSLGLSFSFSSPVGNLVFGTAAHGANYTYQNFNASSSFSGGGATHSVGLNYFLNSSISLMGRFEQINGLYTHGSGNTGLDNFTLNGQSFGLSVLIWL